MEPTVTLVDPSFEILTPLDEIADYARRLEAAGRTCYKSEDKITADSADQFVRRLVRMGHTSVLEHCVITVRIIGDRAMTHQLVRHRIAAYSQESQRYCDYGKKGFQVVLPPSVAKSPELTAVWKKQMVEAYKVYLALRDAGVRPEDARSVLPNAAKTEIVATYDLRQWRHVFGERALNNRAQWQIRQITRGILDRFIELLPAVFDDLVPQDQ